MGNPLTNVSEIMCPVVFQMVMIVSDASLFLNGEEIYMVCCDIVSQIHIKINLLHGIKGTY